MRPPGLVSCLSAHRVLLCLLGRSERIPLRVGPEPSIPNPAFYRVGKRFSWYRTEGGLEYASLVAYNVDMRTLVVGDRNWDCPRLADKIVSRLLDRYGRNLLIIHGAEPGVDQAITMACQARGIEHEARLVARHHTGVPTIAAKNRELIMSRPHFCVAIHQTIRVSNRTRDCILQALQVGITTFLVENEWAIPVRLKPRDKRLGQAASVSPKG